MTTGMALRDRNRLSRNAVVTGFKAAMAQFVANRCQTPVTPPEPPRIAYERLAAAYRRRNEEQHFTGGFTAGQRIALDRLRNRVERSRPPRPARSRSFREGRAGCIDHRDDRPVRTSASLNAA
jgi:hypothetical protein